MCVTWPRKLRCWGPWPLAFDATHGFVGGPSECPGLVVGHFYGEGGFGDVDGHGLVGALTGPLQ